MGSTAKRLLRLRVSLLVGAMAFLSAAACADSTVTPGSRAVAEKTCVEATGVMRREHMEFIKHQRDLTVHQGIRGSKHSLTGCVNCHGAMQDGKAIPVDAEGQFCESCHNFTAVSIDCFQCHRNVPAEQSPQGLTFEAVHGHDMAMRLRSSKRPGGVDPLTPEQQED